MDYQDGNYRPDLKGLRLIRGDERPLVLEMEITDLI